MRPRGGAFPPAVALGAPLVWAFVRCLSLRRASGIRIMAAVMTTVLCGMLGALIGAWWVLGHAMR